MNRTLIDKTLFSYLSYNSFTDINEPSVPLAVHFLGLGTVRINGRTNERERMWEEEARRKGRRNKGPKLETERKRNREEKEIHLVKAVAEEIEA